MAANLSKDGAEHLDMLERPMPNGDNNEAMPRHRFVEKRLRCGMVFSAACLRSRFQTADCLISSFGLNVFEVIDNDLPILVWGIPLLSSLNSFWRAGIFWVRRGHRSWVALGQRCQLYCHMWRSFRLRCDLLNWAMRVGGICQGHSCEPHHVPAVISADLHWEWMTDKE